MVPLEHVYEAAMRAARPVIGLAGRVHPKLGRGVAGRREAAARLEAWAAASRDPARPLVWLHAPSVGEALMAQAIAGVLRERSAVQLAFTHFSPSAERIADRVGADVAGYLPWDVRSDMDRALAALRPAVVAFVRTETWPVLTSRAAALGVALVLVNGVVAPDSSRLRPWSRRLLGPSYARLNAVGAVTPEHAARFQALGVPAERTEATGDARFDQVWARTRAFAEAAGRDRRAVGESASQPPAARLVALLRDPGVFTVVAGSTWPADEARLVAAFARFRASRPARLVVAPHEPDEGHLRGLERALAGGGLEHGRLGEVERGAALPPEVVVVDRVGVLADLYAAGEVAYVGGGYHRAGLHSVVEPAALGVPVLFGPRHGGAREAAELAGAGGGFTVEDAADLESRLRRLAVDEPGRAAAGEAARRYVASQLGGARRNAELIERFLGQADASTGAAGHA